MFSIIYEPVHGIIYKNSKKEKRVMRHSEIHKFCDATLNRVLEGLKSYNNDVKYGYVQRELTNDEVEYLKLFEEEIEVRLKYRNQMRRWDMCFVILSAAGEKDQLPVLFRREVVEDSHKMHDYRRLSSELKEAVRMEDEYINELQMLDSYEEVWKSVRYGVSNGLDTAYWGFLRVGTMLDIFQNIIFIPYFQYGILVFSGYGILSIIPLWSLVSTCTDMPYLP
ncbi:hypothetical protein Tco_0004094 [Tanacetum coccineum]